MNEQSSSSIFTSSHSPPAHEHSSSATDDSQRRWDLWYCWCFDYRWPGDSGCSSLSYWNNSSVEWSHSCCQSRRPNRSRVVALAASPCPTDSVLSSCHDCESTSCRATTETRSAPQKFSSSTLAPRRFSIFWLEFFERREKKAKKRRDEIVKSFVWKDIVVWCWYECAHVFTLALCVWFQHRNSLFNPQWILGCVEILNYLLFDQSVLSSRLCWYGNHPVPQTKAEHNEADGANEENNQQSYNCCQSDVEFFRCGWWKCRNNIFNRKSLFLYHTEKKKKEHEKQFKLMRKELFGCSKCGGRATTMTISYEIIEGKTSIFNFNLQSSLCFWTYTVVIFEKIVFGIDFSKNVIDRNNRLRLRIDSVKEQVCPVHSNSTNTVDMVSHVVDDDMLLCHIGELEEDFITLRLNLGWWSWQNHSYKLVRIVNPNLWMFVVSYC